MIIVLFLPRFSIASLNVKHEIDQWVQLDSSFSHQVPHAMEEKQGRESSSQLIKGRRGTLQRDSF